MHAVWPIPPTGLTHEQELRWLELMRLHPSPPDWTAEQKALWQAMQRYRSVIRFEKSGEVALHELINRTNIKANWTEDEKIAVLKELRYRRYGVFAFVTWNRDHPLHEWKAANRMEWSVIAMSEAREAKP